MAEQSESGESADTYQQDCTLLRGSQFQSCMRDWYLIPCPRRNVSLGAAVHLTLLLKGGPGAVKLDLELLKQYRVSAVLTDSDFIERSGAPDRVWLEYAYRKLRPVLKILPTKLAEWIGENMHDELGFPDKQDPAKWSVSELNDILHKHMVPDRNGCLHTFGCLP